MPTECIRINACCCFDPDSFSLQVHPILLGRIPSMELSRSSTLKSKRLRNKFLFVLSRALCMRSCMSSLSRSTCWGFQSTGLLAACELGPLAQYRWRVSVLLASLLHGFCLLTRPLATSGPHVLWKVCFEGPIGPWSSLVRDSRPLLYKMINLSNIPYGLAGYSTREFSRA